MSTTFSERYATSLELPNPADLPGQTILCYERGVSQLCAWTATGGESNAIWQPQGLSYYGPAAGRPAANRVRAGARSTLTDSGGGTFVSDGTTWQPA